MKNLSSFDGDVIPVNPERDSVLGSTSYPTIGDIPDPEAIDLAVIAVPASADIGVIRQVGQAGVVNVVVTAGFSETGAEGERRERELIDGAEEYGLNLVGPNCVGVISTHAGLNATFVQGRPPEGSISLMSQSVAFIAAVLGWATQHDIGFRNVVSLGNEDVPDENDFIAEWGDDPDTEVILAYPEDIYDGQLFIETAREVTPATPIAIIKSGRTEAGAEAATSHTGSIAGSDEAYQAGLDQAGALRTMDIQEVFDFGRVLSGEPLLEHDNVAVVTNGGGPVVMKIVSPDILHKSDIGGVEVGVSIEDVRDTYQVFLDRAADYDPDATILGVQVEELVDLDEETETIVGVNYDPQFGHLLMIGLGGIFIQIFEDTSFRVLPVSEREARAMKAEIHAAPMLRGARGRTPGDIDTVVETIQRVSQLVTDFPAIRELDINPLVVAPDGVCAVDLRLTVDRKALSLTEVILT